MNQTAEAPQLGWNCDPAGRHHLRWYDGDGWTAEVSDGAGVVLDRFALPVSDRRRSLFSLLVVLTPGLVLLALVVFAISG